MCTNKYSWAPEILRGTVTALNPHHSNKHFHASIAEKLYSELVFSNEN